MLKAKLQKSFRIECLKLKFDYTMAEVLILWATLLQTESDSFLYTGTSPSLRSLV